MKKRYGILDFCRRAKDGKMQPQSVQSTFHLSYDRKISARAYHYNIFDWLNILLVSTIIFHVDKSLRKESTFKKVFFSYSYSNFKCVSKSSRQLIRINSSKVFITPPTKYVEGKIFYNNFTIFRQKKEVILFLSTVQIHNRQKCCFSLKYVFCFDA